MRKVPLSEVCEINSGGTPSRSKPEYFKGEIPWAKISDIENAENNYIYDTDEKISSAGLKNIRNKIFPKGTLLFAIYGSIGKTAFAGKEISTNQAILGIRTKNADQLNLTYLNNWFKANKEKLIGQGRGVALKNLSATFLRELLIPLPPLEDQKRIASILTRAEKLIAKRKESIWLLDELLKSTFLEMFGDLNSPKYETVMLEQISKKITDGTHQSPKFVEEGIPFLFVSNIVENKIDYNTKKFISQDEYERLNKRTPVELNDILFTSVGSYGNAALVTTSKPFSFQRHIAYIKPDSNSINPKYLFGALRSDYVKMQVERSVRGVAQKTLNLKDLKNINIILPPEKLQKKYVELLDHIESIKTSYQTSLTELENLYGSLSQKAFKGELDLTKVQIQEEYETVKKEIKPIKIQAFQVNKDTQNENSEEVKNDLKAKGSSTLDSVGTFLAKNLFKNLNVKENSEEIVLSESPLKEYISKNTIFESFKDVNDIFAFKEIWEKIKEAIITEMPEDVTFATGWEDILYPHIKAELFILIKEKKLHQLFDEEKKNILLSVNR